MVDEITGKMICRQMRLRYAGLLAIAAIVGALIGFFAVLTASETGWLHLFALFYLLILAGSATWAVILICKIVNIRQHRVFQRYGTPEQLAETITAGLRDPSYRERQGADFGLLMTEQFLVSSQCGWNYLELKDIRAVQRIARRSEEDVNVADMGKLPLTIGVTAAIFFLQAWHPTEEQFRTDQLCIWDAEGRKHRYRINRTETESVLWLLRELIPDLEMKPTVQI